MKWRSYLYATTKGRELNVWASQTIPGHCVGKSSKDRKTMVVLVVGELAALS